MATRGARMLMTISADESAAPRVSASAATATTATARTRADHAPPGATAHCGGLREGSGQAGDELAGARAEGEQEGVVDRDDPSLPAGGRLRDAGQGEEPVDAADGLQSLRHDEDGVGVGGHQCLGRERDEGVQAGLGPDVDAARRPR